MKALVSFCTTLLISLSSFAQNTACPQHFHDGKAPEFMNPRLASKTTPLCYEAFAVMYSGISRTPLWSAEHIDTEEMILAKKTKRHDVFHPESRLPPQDRAELSDYARSGYDRGHMTPAGDMPSPSAQDESFSLANIVPQARLNNQQLWAAIEQGTREMAKDRGSLYVVTGPLFEGASLKRLNGRVLVPTHVFKAIYDAKRQQAGAYIAPNTDDLQYDIVSIADLERQLQIRLFPDMPDNVRNAGMDLPKPKLRHSRK